MTLSYSFLYFFIFLALVFSHDFHKIWLLYDFLAFFSIYVLFKRAKVKKVYVYASLMVFSLLLYSLFNGVLTLVSFLTFWDNFKHIFIFLALSSFYSGFLFRKHQENITLYMLIVFSVQIVFISFQYNVGNHFDDIAGTFGYHSSHSIGFFSLLLIALLLFRQKINIKLLLFVFVITISINFLAENFGFYFLLVLLMIFRFSYKIKDVFILLLFILIGFIILNELSILDSIISRLVSSFDFTVTDASSVTGRGVLLTYAYDLGGWFGSGIGSYSEVYGMEGAGVESLVNSQIAISTFTILIAEIGLLGLLLTLIVYSYIFAYKFKVLSIEFIFVFVFITASFFYARQLNDERLAYMLILILIVIGGFFEERRLIK